MNPRLLFRWLGFYLQDLNYRHTIYPISKKIRGIEYKSYNFFAPHDDITFQNISGNVDKGDVVFDVGAFYGNYSIPLGVLGCDVYAFEPSPEAYKYLLKNIDVNEVDIKPLNIGLADETGEFQFYLSSRPGRSSFVKHKAEWGDSNVESSTIVSVETIDHLVSKGRVPCPDHIKVDVEGFGLEVLKGASKTISDHRPIIYFEPHKLKSEGYRKDDLLALFEKHSYNVTISEYPWICKPTEYQI